MRPTTPPRTSTASAPTGWPEARTTGSRSAAAELNGSGAYRIAWIRATSTWPPAMACTGARCARLTTPPWRLVLAPAGVIDYPPSSSVTDVIAVPGTNGAQGPRRRRVGRLQRPAGGRRQRLLRRHRRAGQLHADHPDRRHRPERHRADDVQRVQRLAVRGRPGHHDRRPARRGRLPVEVRQPGRPVDADRRHRQAGRLAARRWVTRRAATTRASRPTTTRTSSPTRTTASTSTCSSKRSSSRPTAARRGTPSGRTGTTTSPATRPTTTRTPARATTHPDQHAGMIFGGQFWTGSDGGVWRRPLTWHERGQLDEPQRDAAHPAELLDRGRQGRQRPGVLGRPAGQR